MRGSGEIDLIAGFQTQTNRPKMPFETRARINLPAYIVRPQIIDRTRKACKAGGPWIEPEIDKDRKSTRLNSSHQIISYAVFCLKNKNNTYLLNSCCHTNTT